MAEGKQPTTGPFDVGTVRELVQLMEKFDLSEVDLNHGDQRIRLRRGGKFIAAHGWREEFGIDCTFRVGVNSL